jgi:small-conductance mechanosensitive channel
VAIGAAFHHPPAEVIDLLERTTAAVEGVLPSPPPRAFLLNYGDSSIQYGVRFWIASALANTATSSAVQQAIWQAFREHGIEIPYPHQVQVEGGPPSAGPVGQTRQTPEATVAADHHSIGAEEEATGRL